MAADGAQPALTPTPPDVGPAPASPAARHPSQVPTSGHTRASGLWAAVVVGLLVLLVLVIFILENGQRASISFMGAHGHLPEGVALLLAAVIGGLFVVLAGVARILQLRLRAGERNSRHRRSGQRRSLLPFCQPTPRRPAVATHPRAGQPAERSDLVDVARLVTAYYSEHPDPSVPEQRVSFGTSGHRGSSLRASFNEDHIVATTQAICDYRARAGTDGPLFLARDTHALSEPAWVTAVEVLAANEVTVLVDARSGYTPTPALSHAVLAHNRAPGRRGGLADGIVITPSHNPPSDGGFKYNPPDGGPGG